LAQWFSSCEGADSARAETTGGLTVTLILLWQRGCTSIS
jgi:hypothetical protein